jgi:hypothetical protein
MAAIAAWNTVYLTEAIETVRKRGEEISEKMVAHIAPLGWEHINLTGNYHFALQVGRSLENLRLLRLQGRNKAHEHERKQELSFESLLFGLSYRAETAHSAMGGTCQSRRSDV